MRLPKSPSAGRAAGLVRPRPSWPLAAFVVLPLLVAGCSAVPDWADPSDWFAKDEAPNRVAQGQAAEEAAQAAPFPNLARVPDQPPSVTAPAARAQIREDLAADRANATFTGERPAAGESDRASAVRPSSTLVGAGIADAPPAPAIAQGLVPEAAPGGTEGGAGPTLVTAAGGSELVAIIYFRHGSASLDEADRRVLRDVATLQRQRGGTLRVVGHASARTGVVEPVQHSLANFEMSLRRANEVAAELVALGVDRAEVEAEARSDAQPVYHEFMTTGEAGNRRTEIFLEN